MTLLKGGAAVGDAKGSRLTDDTLMMPVAVIRHSALERNRAFMRSLLARTGVRLAPHGKTTMAPHILRMQVDDGAWALTAATASHVRLYRQWGFRRILMANQLVGAANIGWVLDELERDPSFEFFCLVDSPAGVAALADTARARESRRGWDVLIEVGAPGRRAGVRSLTAALALAREIAARAPVVRLRGVEAFEGVFQAEPDGVPGVEALGGLVLETLDMLRAEGLFAPGETLLSIGGSGYYDLAAKLLDRPGIVPVLRSGCYITHDAGMYERLWNGVTARDPSLTEQVGRPGAALEVWGHVQSLPEPGLAIIGIGKRDIGNDAGPPVPVGWAVPGEARRPLSGAFEVAALYDQHLCLRIPRDVGWQVGDLIGFGVSHPCTTFDRWRAIHLVDDEDRVVETIETFF